MGTPTTTVSYPFDPTGQATTNLITGERQILSPPDWSDFYFILPQATPYFAASLQMVLQPSGKVLKEGVDYNPTHRFYDATIQCASPVYGSITFLDKTLAGVVQLSYQTLGGDWTLNTAEIAQVLANNLLDPRITTWEEVVNLPFQFPPIAHQWDIVDMTGAKDVVAALNNMVTALLQSGDQGLAQHLADFNNPHRVTATQVGLGNVGNFGLAAIADAQAGSSNSLYMTPSTTQAEIAQFALIPLNAHIANTGNPHNTTAAQLGLGSVQNYGMATSAAAVAGVATNGYMNPATTSAAITAQAIGPLNNHISDINNPHQVNATQVGLSNVPNYPMATQTEALAGTATDRFMSPALVQSVLNTGLGGNLQAHINDHGNPHVVTAAQVGLGNVQNYGVASLAMALAGTDNASYMTPSLTDSLVTTLLTPFAAHISNTNNPHSTTAAEVGLGNVNNYGTATNADALAGTSNTLYMTPAATAAAIQTLSVSGLAAHLADFNNPHETTAAQVGLDQVQNLGFASLTDAQAGTASNGYMNAALTAAAINSQVGSAFSSHVGNYNNPHQVTAEQLDVYTTEQVDGFVATLTTGKLGTTAQAADSAMLAGQTPQQLINTIVASLPATSRYQYPAINPGVDSNNAPVRTGITWTTILNVPPYTPDPTLPLPPCSFIITGGAGRTDTSIPVYQVMMDPLNPTDYQLEQIAGDAAAIELGYVLDSSTNTFTLFMKSPVSRNAISLAVLADPGNAFSAYTTIYDIEPAGIVYMPVTGSAGGGSASTKYVAPDAGELAFPQGYAQNTLASASINGPGNIAAYQTPVQFLSIAETQNEATSAAAIATSYKVEYRNFGRLASFGSEARSAAGRNVWSWDNTNSLLKCNSAQGAMQTLLAPEALPVNQFMVEVELSSTDVADEAVGICLGHFIQDGKSMGLWAMRTPGGTAAASAGDALPGGNIYGLFSVVLNAFQNDAVALASTNAGLIWGDGVADANRASTPYVPQSETAGTNGWSNNGKVRIRFTLNGANGTVETTNFGSTNYVDAAKVSFTLSDAGAASTWANGPAYGGYRWGLAQYAQPNAEFNILNAPDQFARYMMYSPQADGTDASMLYFYTGNTAFGSNGWVADSIANTNATQPGRQIFSPVNSTLWFTRRDGTVTPLYGTGQSVLTT